MAGKPDMVTAGSAGGVTLILKLFWAVAAGVALSVTLTTKVTVPAAAIVPLISPALLIEMPEGSPVADHVYGGVPPKAAMENE